MKIAAAFILSGLLLASCAPSIPYSTEYPLTQFSFRARDSAFSGGIPLGWFSSTDDSLAPALVAWLIREDYAATLSIKELRLDQRSRKQVADDGLALLASLNAAFERHTQQMREVREFRIEGKDFCGYEFGSSETPGRAVVFSTGGRYYSCTAQRIRGSWSRNDFNTLFGVQQTVLRSLTY